jgi:ketosteroid isomerase-like protein
MKGILFITAIVICFCSCNQTQAGHHHLDRKALIARQDSLKDDLLKTDIAFSQLSENKGRNAAFLAYADSSATMLRNFSPATTGIDAIAKLLNQFPDSAVKLSWLPISSDVALSGDLGYTYGTYTIESKGSDHFGGTYCTVWRRHKTSGWKFVLSTGNEGIKPAQ